MKKIFLIMAVAVAAAACSPLRLAMNVTDSKGVRTLATSNIPLMGNVDGSMEIALAARVEKKDTIMAVVLTVDADSGHGIFNKGNKMMFRLADNSVIELENLYDKEYEEQTETYTTTTTVPRYGYGYAYDYFWGDIYVAPYMVNQMVPEVRTRKNSYSYALYLISKRQLLNIINSDVKKLRVEIENNDLDMPDPRGVSSMFKDMYSVLREGLVHNYVRKTF